MKKQPKTLTTKGLQRILHLRRQLKTIDEIEQITGYDRTTVWWHASKYGMGSVRGAVPEDVQDRILHLYNAGNLSMDAVADLVELHTSVVRRVLRKHGAVRKDHYLSAPLAKEKMERYRHIWTLYYEHGSRKAAEMLGIAQGSVCYYAKMYLKKTELPSTQALRKAA
jgi:hypothetical protein